MFVTLLLLLLGAWVVIRHYSFEARNQRLVFPTPGLIHLWLLFSFYLVACFLFSLQPDMASHLFSYYGFEEGIYERVAWAGFVSLLFFSLGLRAASRRARTPFKLVGFLERKGASVTASGFFGAAVSLYLLGLILQLLKESLGWTHYGGALSVLERSTNQLNQIITYALTGKEVAFNLVSLLFVSGRLNRAQRLLYCAVFLSEIALALFSGGALSLITMFAPFFVWQLYSYTAQASTRRGKVLIQKMLVLVILVLLAFAGKSVARRLHDYEVGVSLFGAAGDIDSAFAALRETSISDSFSAILDYLALGSNSMAVIMTRLDNHEEDYLNGTSLFLVARAFVPRLLDPSKPDIALGMWFTDHYWRDWRTVLQVGEGTQGTAFLLPGEMYFNFGWWGLPIGMFLLGFVFDYLGRRLLAGSQLGLIGQLMISQLILTLSLHIFSLASLITEFVKTGLISCLFLWVVIVIARLMSVRKPYMGRQAGPLDALTP